jgi:hypothetical protein
MPAPRRLPRPWSVETPACWKSEVASSNNEAIAALGKLPVCPEKLQIVMAVTEALSQFLATANAFMEERKSEGHNTDKLPGDGHEKDSRNFGPSLPIDHRDDTDSGLRL